MQLSELSQAIKINFDVANKTHSNSYNILILTKSGDKHCFHIEPYPLYQFYKADNKAPAHLINCQKLPDFNPYSNILESVYQHKLSKFPNKSEILCCWNIGKYII